MTTLEQLKEEMAEGVYKQRNPYSEHPTAWRIYLPDAKAALQILTPHLEEIREGLEDAGNLIDAKSYKYATIAIMKLLQTNPLMQQSEVKDEKNI